MYGRGDPCSVAALWKPHRRYVAGTSPVPFAFHSAPHHREYDGTVVMLPQADRPGSGPRPLSQLVPILCLIGVVALLSSITPAIKYTLQHSSVDVLGLACSRVVIGFVFLIAITAWVDFRGLQGLKAPNILQLAMLGMLGVGAYAVAAWGLWYTTVTHYAL